MITQNYKQVYKNQIFEKKFKIIFYTLFFEKLQIGKLCCVGLAYVNEIKL